LCSPLLRRNRKSLSAECFLFPTLPRFPFTPASARSSSVREAHLLIPPDTFSFVDVKKVLIFQDFGTDISQPLIFLIGIAARFGWTAVITEAVYFPPKRASQTFPHRSGSPRPLKSHTPPLRGLRRFFPFSTFLGSTFLSSLSGPRIPDVGLRLLFLPTSFDCRGISITFSVLDADLSTLCRILGLHRPHV